MGATINVKGKTYDIDEDFTWRELATVEDLSTIPLGRAGALDFTIVFAAFVFVVMKRDEPALEWGAFMDSGGPQDVSDGDDDTEPEDAGQPAETVKAKRARPTKPSA